MTPISICIIAKNEEKHIDHCLSAIQKHLREYPHEIVLVDTGSTDSTVEIARKYTDQIYFFEWIGDFSAARNFSLSKASHDWVLILDCDEYITALDPIVFDQMARNFPQHVGLLTRRNHYEMNGMNSIHTDLAERFFNRKLYHYEAIIHEQVRPIFSTLKMKRMDISLLTEHVGYIGTPEELIPKANRNNELLLKMLEKTPEDPYLYFQLGQSYNMIQDKEKACYYYSAGLEYASNPALEYVQMMVLGYGYALIDLNRHEEALFLENIYEDFCQTADFICLMGIIYLRNGLVAQAVQEFTKATTTDLARVEGTNSFIPHYNLGCIHEVLGNTKQAITHYQACQDFPLAKERLQLLHSS